MTFVPTTECSSCHNRLNAADLVGGYFDKSPPEIGDLNVCWYCGHLTKFGEGLTLEEISEAEFASFPEELKDSILQAQAAARYAQSLKTTAEENDSVADSEGGEYD